MADAIAQIVEETVRVTVQGADLVQVYVVAASAEADRAEDAADTVTASIAGAAASAASSAASATLAAAAALTAPKVYASTAAGLAAVAEGDTFWVQSAYGDILLYRETAGVAVLLGSLGLGSTRLLSSFGALPDARQVSDAAMTSGSAVLTSATAAFTAADVGKSITVGGAGAAGQKLRSTVLSRQSATQVTLAANASTTVSATGATFGTNCAPPLQAGLNAVAAAGGGTLVNDGSYYLGTGVLTNFQGLASQVNFFGTGSSSRLHICVADDEDGLTFLNAQHLINIEGVTFVGTPKAKNDARKVIKFDQCWAAKVQRCGFYGLAVLDGDAVGAVVWSERSRYTGLDNQFGGCAANAGSNTPVVKHVAWFGVDHDHEQYIDHGQLGPITHSKTPDGQPLAWIMVADANAEAPVAQRNQRTVTIQGCRFDEGASRWVQTASGGRIWRVRVADCEGNASDASGFGLTFAQTDEVVIERCTVGYADAVTTDMASFTECGHVLIDRCRTWASVTRITANIVTTLEVRDTVGITSYSLTNVTNFIPSAEGRGTALFTKAGAISDADFLAPPAPGFTGYNSADNKYMTRGADGVWRSSVALT